MKLKSTILLSTTLVATVFAGLAGGGCGDDDDVTPTPAVDGGADTSVTPPGNDSGPQPPPPPPVDSGSDTGTPVVELPVAKRASKTSTIAISDDDKIVGMVNPEANSISFFKTADNTRSAVVSTGAGSNPSAIVIASDNKTAWVANRGTATVVKITGIDTATPVVGTPINVGSEPTGIALSPKGTKLFVAEYAEGTVGIVDTAAGTRTAIAAAVRNPRAVAVTNNLDTNEADETVVVTEFFGEPVAGKEAQNDGRVAHVRLFGFDGSDKGKIDFNPTTQTAPLELKAAPNQLHSVAVNGTKIYVPSISAAPALPVAFNKNVYSVMLVGDLGTKLEDTSGAGTKSLTEAVGAATALPAGSKKFALADVVDIDFVPGGKIGYAVSRGADVVQRLDYSGANLVIGSPQNLQIDVQGAPAATDVKACHNPTGIAIGGALQKGFVNCWGSHRMAVIDFTAQAVATNGVIESTAAATSTVDKGRHFFFTGRGRWSGDGTGAAAPTAAGSGTAWGACSSCHPDGLSDNVTWIFGAGPRQSTSLDGSFSHGASAQKQRLFNWSGIIDEMHDFEANTRGTSGGLGAITNAPTTADCGDLTKETRRLATSVTPLITNALPGGLQLSNKDLADGAIGDDAGGVQCKRSDWDDINEYTKAIVPPKGKRFGAAAAVTAGKTIFTDNGCAKCHGGGGWTVSRRSYNPQAASGGTNAFTALDFPSAGITPGAGLGPFLSKNTKQISTQQPGTPAPAAPDDVASAPPQGSCVIRNVSTFGVRLAGGTFALDAPTTLPLEIRPNPTAGQPPVRAQGFAGFNVPSLYGMTVGGPFLHHGQAATLTTLFTDDRFKGHWTAGNPNFDPAAGTNRADLIAFIESIDSSTAEIAPGTGFDVCQP